MQAFRKLHTHIWHAKRMHMQKLCGTMVALQRCDRGLTAAIKVGTLISIIYGIAMYKRHDLSRMPVKAASFKIVHTMDVSNSKANHMRLPRNSNPSW